MVEWIPVEDIVDSHTTASVKAYLSGYGLLLVRAIGAGGLRSWGIGSPGEVYLAVEVSECHPNNTTSMWSDFNL